MSTTSPRCCDVAGVAPWVSRSVYVLGRCGHSPSRCSDVNPDAVDSRARGKMPFWEQPTPTDARAAHATDSRRDQRPNSVPGEHVVLVVGTPVDEHSTRTRSFPHGPGRDIPRDLRDGSTCDAQARCTACHREVERSRSRRRASDRCVVSARTHRGGQGHESCARCRKISPGRNGGRGRPRRRAVRRIAPSVIHSTSRKRSSTSCSRTRGATSSSRRQPAVHDRETTSASTSPASATP